MSLLSYEFSTRVRYKDTDQMGIMHHSNYIVIYEMARTEWLREMGLPYAEFERRGIMSPIVEVQSKYLYPAFYDEVLSVKVFMEELPTARLVIGSEVYNEQGRLINTGKVTLGFMHADTRRPCRAPEWFIEKINAEIAKQTE
jgi:acyl-CoA thioester hydrolase